MVLNYSHRFDEALQQLATWYITGQLKVSTSKPIFHQVCLSRVGVNNAIDFALGTFQVNFTLMNFLFIYKKKRPILYLIFIKKKKKKKKKKSHRI